MNSYLYNTELVRYRSIYVPTLTYGHNLWVGIERECVYKWWKGAFSEGPLP